MKLSLKVILIIIAAAGFIAYFNSLENGFVYDDNTLIVGNAANLNVGNFFGYFANSGNYKYAFGNLYRPLVMVSFAVDKAIYGINPKGFHFTNILFNSATSVLLFLILAMLFGKYKWGIWASMLSALIFAVHPVHTEAVTFISSRTDVIGTFFFFAAFYFYLRLRGFVLPYFRQTKDKKDKSHKKETPLNANRIYIYIILLYFAGLFSKEMVIVFPAVTLLFDLLILKKKIKEIIYEYIAIGIVSGIYLVIRYFAIKDSLLKPELNWFYGHSSLTVFSTMVKTIPVYLKLLFAPIGLNYTYNGDIKYSYSPVEINSILSILVILLIIAAGIYLIKKKTFYSFSIFVFFITLLPVLNFNGQLNIMAERYLYLTSFPFCIAIGYFLSEKINDRNKNTFIGLISLVIIIFAFLTYQRNIDWKTEENLWKSAADSESPSAMINMAGLYTRTGQVDKAEKLYYDALKINNNQINAHINIGIINIMKNKLDTAEVHLKTALSLDPKSQNANYIYSKLKLAQNQPIEAKRILQFMKDSSLEYKDSKKMLDSLSKIY